MRRLFLCSLVFFFCMSVNAADGFLKGKLLKIDMKDVIGERGGNKKDDPLVRIRSSLQILPEILGSGQQYHRKIPDDRNRPVDVVYLIFIRPISSPQHPSVMMGIFFPRASFT